MEGMLPDVHFTISNLSAALNVLTSMITPALLLSACGTFILSTSGRLARVVDRMRVVSENVERLSTDAEAQLREERIQNGRNEIRQQTKRLKLLQWALTCLYIAAVTFVFTSVSIGVVAAVSLRLYWIPVALGILGACFLLLSCLMLLVEARQAVSDLYAETEFHRRLAKHHASMPLSRGGTLTQP